VGVCRLDFKPPKTDNRRQTQEVKAQSSTVYNSWVKAHKSMGPLLTYAPFHTVTVRHTPSQTHTTVHTHTHLHKLQLLPVIGENGIRLSTKLLSASFFISTGLFLTLFFFSTPFINIKFYYGLKIFPLHCRISVFLSATLAKILNKISPVD